MPRTPSKSKKAEVLSTAKQVRNREQVEPEKEERRVYFPTGSTLLNLAVSDDAFGGWGSGKIINLVGDSNTGKTLLALTGLMEMAIDEQYSDHLLIYDDAENALEMDVRGMFGDQLSDRLQDPYGNLYGSEEFRSSETIEDVRNNLWRLLEEGTPFLYVLDSYDAVTSRDEIKRQEQENKGKEQNKDYPRGPAILSETLRKTKSKLKFADSGFLVISQTRDEMNPMTFGAQKRRAGGKALKFYSSHEVWLAVGKGGQIKKTVRKKSYTIGWNIIAKSARSKLNGKKRDVPIVCYTKHGVDDISANIEWLLSVGYWTGSRNSINSKGFCKENKSMQDLILWTESHNKEETLKVIVEKEWQKIESELSVTRKKRFEK